MRGLRRSASMMTVGRPNCAMAMAKFTEKADLPSLSDGLVTSIELGGLSAADKKMLLRFDRDHGHNSRISYIDVARLDIHGYICFFHPFQEHLIELPIALHLAVQNAVLNLVLAHSHHICLLLIQRIPNHSLTRHRYVV